MRGRRFLDELYRPAREFRVPQDPDTIVCRCEEISAGQIRETVEVLFSDPATEFLLDGELLPPAQLAQMKTTVPAPDLSLRGIEMEYGLGLASHELPCGVEAWGHGGDLPGVHTRNAFTEDGRGATFTITGEPANADPEDLHQYVDWEDAVDDAVCAQPLR